MKLFVEEPTLLTTPEPDRAGQLAGQLIDTVPLVMRALRDEIRSRRPVEFTVPQFRVLAFLRRNENATLTDVANHIGLMRPTMSKMIDSLVRRGWVGRVTDAHDRRCIRLRLTAQGADAINAAREQARMRLAGLIQPLSPDQQQAVLIALQVLRQVFTPAPVPNGMPIE